MRPLEESENSIDDSSNGHSDKPSKLLKDDKEEMNILNNKFLIAIREKNLEEVKSLLQKINVNFKDQNECTPLHLAVETGDVKIIRLLLDNGADLCCKNNALKTPLDDAKKMNRSDIVKELEKSSRAVDKLQFDQNKKKDNDTNYDKGQLNAILDALKEKKYGKNALDILNLISYCLPENIPVVFLSSLLPNEKRLNVAIELLKQDSIISVQQNLISISKLVQQVTKLRLRKENKEVRFLINTLMLFKPHNVKFEHIDHVISIWSYTGKFKELLEGYSCISTLIIKELSDWGRIEQAVSIGEEVAKLLEAPAKFDREVLARLTIIKNNTAMANMKRGEYKIALDGFLEVHKLQLTITHRHDSVVLSTTNNIHTVLMKMNRNQEALKWGYDLLAGYRTKYEESHPKILSIKSSLAIILGEERKPKEASRLMKEVHVGQKKSVGDLNPDTLSMRGNMGSALSNLNELDKSLKVLQEVLRDQEATLPKNHHSTLNTKSSIGNALIGQKKFNEAMKVYQELFAIKKELYGENHFDVLDISVHIALCLEKENKHEEAFKMAKDALEKLQKVVGPDHPKTINAQTIFAHMLYTREKLTESIECYKDLLVKQISVLGENHLDTLSSRQYILEMLMRLHKFREGLDFSLQVLESKIKIYGKDHPTSLDARVSVSLMCCHNGNSKLGLDILAGVLEVQEKTLGANHADCQDTRNKIAKIAASRLQNKSDQGTNRSYCAVEQLLQKESAINIKDAQGLTLLHHAVNDANEKQVERVLEQGAEVFILTNKGNTPLHMAVLKGHLKCVELLLQKINPNKLIEFIDVKTITNATTALHAATKLGHFDIVKYLLQNRATYCPVNKDGKTPLDVSTDSKVVDFLKLIQELFEAVKKADAKDVVCKLKTLPVDEFLAVTNTRNCQGSTLSQAAMLNKQKYVAAEILKMVQKSKPK